MNYDHKKIEKKWMEKWLNSKNYSIPKIKKDDKKFYSLYSFPYPSGAGLHVGHVEGMVANDISARFYRMNGKKVLMPMGWDSFGLPAENYAIKTGVHPQENTDEAVATFKKQINAVGISVAWGSEVGAHWKEYYKWTQWIFLQLYKKGLAYKKEAPVNWCDKCKTSLANEQVVDGKCERCDTEVVQKNMSQWFFKITEYADRLVDDLDKVDWLESTKITQRNWIGRSEGAEIKFEVVLPSGDESAEDKRFITVYSTAHDTIFGATFMVIAPEHELVDLLTTPEQKKAVEEYKAHAKTKNELERTALEKDKTGVFTGGHVINPMTGEEIPVWIADYVITTYGTGAVMGVPGADERDYEFATKYNIPIVYVTEENTFINYSKEIKENPSKFRLINSGKYNGLNFIDARESMLKEMSEKNIARKKTNYKLRDWLVSRQRYWGCPIPIVYDPEGNPHPVDENDLPVILPHNVEFLPTGESPLKYSEEFHKSAEERYGKGWRREIDTLDTFIDSSWYFFRHPDAQNSEKIFDSEKINKWLPTDLYMIGAEHIVLHLMYSRFFTKFFYDQGLINFDEPFYRMRHMGLIQGSDGRKMSKRWGNVINPTDEIEKYGADTLRIYEMFMGPLEESKPWNDQTIQGVRRFIERVYKLKDHISTDENPEVEKTLHKLIKKVEEDIPELKFNTSVAKFMEFVNLVEKKKQITKNQFNTFIKILAPFAPFITEDLWHQINQLPEETTNSIHLQEWPRFDSSKIIDDVIKIGVQVNGKHRGAIEVSPDESEGEVKTKVMALEEVNRWLEGKEIKKFIYIKARIVNLVV